MKTNAKKEALLNTTLSKEQIKSLDIASLMPSGYLANNVKNEVVKIMSHVIPNFSMSLEHDHISNLSDAFTVGELFDFFEKYSQAYGKTFPCNMPPILFIFQKRLKYLNFTEKDGYFMRLYYDRLKPKQYYIDRLVYTKKFSEKEAHAAVELGNKAGWITAIDLG